LLSSLFSNRPSSSVCVEIFVQRFPIRHMNRFQFNDEQGRPGRTVFLKIYQPLARTSRFLQSAFDKWALGPLQICT